MTLKEQIAVMQAALNGKHIQYNELGFVVDNWHDCVGLPAWDWRQCDYRVKLEPRVCYANEYKDGVLGTLRKSSESAAEFRGEDWVKVVRFVEVLGEDNERL